MRCLLRRWIPPILSALLVIVLAAALLRGGAEGVPLLGQAAPNFKLETLDGSSLEFAQLRGRPVLINFWASWCLPCREEAPLLQELAARQDDRGLVVVGVVFQDTLKNARAFRDEFNLTFPSVFDPGSRTAIDYGVSAIPETFFVDRHGVVRAFVQGTLTREHLTRELPKIGVTP
ncbi:TlpA family protein disulfide reductase [Deinococcus peraridilitoris]|uniref:TlpA family protein disulfide reductase n=1 Tax=Deinococcus peraridilitoris TaxID=432329 RepID=UPI003CCBDAB9